MDLRRMRELFVAIEQQRVTRDAVENLGPPSDDRFQQMMMERSVQYKAEQQRLKDAQRKIKELQQKKD